MRENYRKKNDQLAEWLNELQPGKDYSISRMQGIGSRLVRKGESVDVSPRLTEKGLHDWIHAYIDGIQSVSDT